MTKNNKRPWQAALVGLVGLILVASASIRVLSVTDWDATVFVGFGEVTDPTTEYAEDRLADIQLRSGRGHDGKYFFVQANDPWLLAPDDNAEVLDRPLYRSQRMLYPLIAGVGGLLSPESIVWGLLVVNVVAMAVGSWVVALLALEMGASAWWGLGFVLNLGLIGDFAIDSAGIVAVLFAFLGIWFLLRERNGLSITSFAMAGLSREVMLIVAVGAAIWLWRRSRRQLGLLFLLVPSSVVALWGLYLRFRVEEGAGGLPVADWPFLGIARSFDFWTRDPRSFAVGITMLLLLILFTRRAVGSSHLVAWAFLGFVPLAAILSEHVWRNWFDISRAIAPIWTSYALLLFAGKVEGETSLS